MMKRVFYSIITSTLLLAACSQDKMPLPVPKTQDVSFGASDTNYVELSPVWDVAVLGTELKQPQDITIGRDGIIFVADRDNDRVLALSKAGQILTHDGLGDIRVPHPQSISIDSKLNVLISNRSDTVWCWPQYLNFVELDSVAQSADFFDPSSNQTIRYTFSEYIDYLAAGGEELSVQKLLFVKDEPLVESLLSVYPIYTAEEEASINGVAAGQYGYGTFYITESHFDRISELKLVPEYAFKSSFGAVLFRYRAIHSRNIAFYGSGAGTVDDPWSIQVDGEGDLYFTQFGGNFRVQKLTAPEFQSAFTLGVHEIMDLDRFKTPTDLALDDLNDLFIIDAQTGMVSKFDNSGGGAGQHAPLGTKGLATTVFDSGSGIMVDNNIVYVVESGKNRIRRFQYSVSESDVPDDDKKP